MSRTHKQTVARAYHKRLRQAVFGNTWAGGTAPQDMNAIRAVLRSATPAERGTIRYGDPLRHYYADLKRKQRRIDRCKAKEAIRADLAEPE